MSHTLLPDYSRARLREGLVSSFSEDDLRNLAFDLNLDYESWAAVGKTSLARELILCLERAGRIRELFAMLRRVRPNVSWEDVPYAPLRGASFPGRYYPLLAEVGASNDTTLEDDLAFYGEDGLNGEFGETIFIPQVPSGARIAVLRVKGTSMNDEGVWEGDYVIVELMDGAQIVRENTMIVTRYLSEEDAVLADEGDSHDIIKAGNIPLRGPTLKIFKGQYQDSNGCRRYRLGRTRDDGKRNSHEIRAVVIEPVGRVLAIHRVVS
jgi:hypothetical protein